MKTDEVLEFIAHRKNWDIAKKRQLIQDLVNKQLDPSDRYKVLFLAIQWLASSPKGANIVVPLGAEVIKAFGCGHPELLAILVKKEFLNALWAMDQSGYVEGDFDRQVECINVTHWILSQLVEEDDAAANELCLQVRSQMATFLSRCKPCRLGPALAISRLIKQHPRCLFSQKHIVKGDSGKRSANGVCEEVSLNKDDDGSEELEMKVCEALIKSIGSLTMPTPDVIILETFAAQVREVAEAVALIWRRGRPPPRGKIAANSSFHEEEEKRVFRCLKIIHTLVSDPGKEWHDPCPALASILQLVPLRLIPGAVAGVLGSGNGSGGAGEGTVAALLCHLLCDWLLRWPGACNLSHWVLALLQGLAPSYPSNSYSPYASHDSNNNRRVSQAVCESRVRILIALTLSNIDKLVDGLNDPSLCQSLLPVVSHMLLGFQHSPEPFLRVCPHLPPLLSRLRDDQEDGVPGSSESLQLLVDLCSMLLFLHGGSDPTRQNLREALEECPLPSVGVPNHEYLLRLRWIPMHRTGFGNYDYSLPSEVPISEPSRGEWTPAVYRTATRAGHVGLSNLGNTCYANSVLQALFMTTRFRRQVLLSSTTIPPSIGAMSGPSIWGGSAMGTWGRVPSGGIPPPKTRPVLSQLRLLFALLSHSPRPSLSPQAILMTAQMAGGHFEAGQQHDCSEFMCFFLDALHEQGKAYAQYVGKEFEEDLDEEVAALVMEPEEDNVGRGESEERANSTQEEEEEEDADMDGDEGEEEEEDMIEGQMGMKRWTTEEDLSSSEGRRLQAKRKALSLAEFSTVSAAEGDSGQDVDEKGSENAENDGMAQSAAQALSDSHSDSTDSGIQSVGEEDGVNVVVSGAGNVQSNAEAETKTDNQQRNLGKGVNKATLWTDGSDAVKLKREFCSIVQQEFGGVAHTMHQCLSCGSVSVRADPFRDLQLAFPEDTEEMVSDSAQESRAFIGPQLPQHMLPAGEVKTDDEEGKDLEKSKEEMEVEDKVTMVKKKHTGPWGVSDLLGHYLSTETLRGENRYRCTKCKGLQDARRSVSIAWPPPRHLLLTLKHFRFDRNTARRSKALRPLRVELSLEVPVALLRSHRSNAAKRRKTRSTQMSSSEENDQKKKGETQMESGEEKVDVKNSNNKDDSAPSCSNALDEIAEKENAGSSVSPSLDCKKTKPDSAVEEGEASGNQDCPEGGSYSRRRRRTRREEEGMSVGQGERPYVEERKVTYHLYAAIVHSGFSLDGGHYYTYARRPQVNEGVEGEEEWCMLNDSQVSAQSGPESFSDPSGHRPQDTPYVLFYMLDGMNSLGPPDWWSLPVELRDAVEADGSKYIREEEDWRWKHSSKGRPGGGFNRRDGDDPPPSSCGGGMGSGFGSMGGHFVF